MVSGQSAINYFNITVFSASHINLSEPRLDKMIVDFIVYYYLALFTPFRKYRIKYRPDYSSAVFHIKHFLLFLTYLALVLVYFYTDNLFFEFGWFDKFSLNTLQVLILSLSCALTGWNPILVFYYGILTDRTVIWLVLYLIVWKNLTRDVMRYLCLILILYLAKL